MSMKYPFERPTLNIRRAYRTQLLSAPVPIRVQTAGDTDVFYFGTGKTHLLFLGAQSAAQWQSAAWAYRCLFYLSDAYMKQTDTFGIAPEFLFSQYTYCVIPVMYHEPLPEAEQTSCPPPANTQKEVRSFGGRGRLTWQAVSPPLPSENEGDVTSMLMDICAVCKVGAAVCVDKGDLCIAHAETSGEEDGISRRLAARIGRQGNLAVRCERATDGCGACNEHIRRLYIPQVRLCVPGVLGNDEESLCKAVFRTLYMLPTVL